MTTGVRTTVHMSTQWGGVRRMARNSTRQMVSTYADHFCTVTSSSQPVLSTTVYSKVHDCSPEGPRLLTIVHRKVHDCSPEGPGLLTIVHRKVHDCSPEGPRLFAGRSTIVHRKVHDCSLEGPRLFTGRSTIVDDCSLFAGGSSVACEYYLLSVWLFCCFEEIFPNFPSS